MNADDPAAAGAPRTFRRTGGSRLLSAGCALLFVAGTISVVATSGITAGFFVLSGLSLLSLANALGAWADRYTLGASGIEYRNRFLELFGARPRMVRWDEVVQVREHRSVRLGRLEPHPSAVFLILRSGRRVVLDSLADFDDVLRAVRRYHDADRAAR
jgi:hypothetical protein